MAEIVTTHKHVDSILLKPSLYEHHLKWLTTWFIRLKCRHVKLRTTAKLQHAWTRSTQLLYRNALDAMNIHCKHAHVEMIESSVHKV